MVTEEGEVPFVPWEMFDVARHWFPGMPKMLGEMEVCDMTRACGSDKTIKVFDPVSAPEHYLQTKITPIEVIVDWKLDFLLGSVVKYIGRAPYKGNELQDLKKAAKWLSMKIELLERGELKETIVHGRASETSK